MSGGDFVALMETPLDASSTTHLSPWRDVVIVAAITVGAALLAAHFEINERVFAATRGWEDVQLDEWPIVVLVLATCLIWLRGGAISRLSRNCARASKPKPISRRHSRRIASSRISICAFRRASAGIWRASSTTSSGST
jgi:hypothetical protein